MPGTDTLLNEMLKHGRYYLIPSLGRRFNDITETGTFPTEWNIGVIKPIYKKKGDKKCPANYRGITLTTRQLLREIVHINFTKLIK